MRPPEMESLAVHGEAFAWVFSCVPEPLFSNPTSIAFQRLPDLIGQHLGHDSLNAWAVGGAP